MQLKSSKQSDFDFLGRLCFNHDRYNMWENQFDVYYNYGDQVAVMIDEEAYTDEFAILVDGYSSCPILRIGDSNRHIRISDDAIARLHEIFARYGGFFPCI